MHTYEKQITHTRICTHTCFRAYTQTHTYTHAHAHTLTAELLTAGKLSELAALALFLMYEKKLGTESFYRPYIQVCMPFLYGRNVWAIGSECTVQSRLKGTRNASGVLQTLN